MLTKVLTSFAVLASLLALNPVLAVTVEDGPVSHDGGPLPLAPGSIRPHRPSTVQEPAQGLQSRGIIEGLLKLSPRQREATAVQVADAAPPVIGAAPIEDAARPIVTAARTVDAVIQMGPAVSALVLGTVHAQMKTSVARPVLHATATVLARLDAEVQAEEEEVVEAGALPPRAEQPQPPPAPLPHATLDPLPTSSRATSSTPGLGPTSTFASANSTSSDTASRTTTAPGSGAQGLPGNAADRSAAIQSNKMLLICTAVLPLFYFFYSPLFGPTLRSLITPPSLLSNGDHSTPAWSERSLVYGRETISPTVKLPARSFYSQDSSPPATMADDAETPAAFASGLFQARRSGICRPPPCTQHVAQFAATSLLKILGLTYHFTPARVVSWWNEIVSAIEALLSATGLDAYVVFGCVPLLERYARGAERPLHTLDTYQLFISALVVASKILCPMKPIPWASVEFGSLREAGVTRSITSLERELLVVVDWDRWMMDIVVNVWRAYEQAVEQRKGEPSGRQEANSIRFSWPSSDTSDSLTGDSHFSGSEGATSRSSALALPHLPSLFLTRSRQGSRPSGESLPRKSSSLWEIYMSDTSRPADPDESPVTLRSASHVQKTVSSGSRMIRTKLSRMFKTK
ncbi:hypothetical protein NMY22_g6013 [Coprinellus aureogranulatus]|nr:hypothetical protein NMY22_g6013 [Coprinellus aureogranulatus]